MSAEIGCWASPEGCSVAEFALEPARSVPISGEATASIASSPIAGSQIGEKAKCLVIIFRRASMQFWHRTVHFAEQSRGGPVPVPVIWS